MTDEERQLEPPADISWMEFEYVPNIPRWMLLGYAATVVLAGVVVGFAITLWLLT